MATEAALDGVTDLLFGQDGHLYFMAEGPQGLLLRRVENGRLKTVAGGSNNPRPPWEAESPQEVVFRSYPPCVREVVALGLTRSCGQFR